MDFQYLAYGQEKRILSGTISAPSEGVAMQALSRGGFRVLSLSPVGAAAASREKLFPTFFRVKPEAVVMFSRQLALLLESGTDIVTALELLQSQTTGRAMKKVLSEAIADLRNGTRLSAALSKHPESFPKIYVQSLIVGEQSGALEAVLRQVADYIEKETKAAKGVQSALRYPIIVSIIALLVVGVMIAFVFPAFASLYSSLGAELPLASRMVLSSVKWLSQYGLYALGLLVAIMMLALMYSKTASGRFYKDKLILRLPMLGKVTHLSELARYCRSMSVLIRAGLPLPNIMSLIIESSGNTVMKQALTRVREAMIKGEGLSKPMSKDPLFLPMMVQMVGVGQATGNLEVTLKAVAAVVDHLAAAPGSRTRLALVSLTHGPPFGDACAVTVDAWRRALRATAAAS